MANLPADLVARLRTATFMNYYEVAREAAAELERLTAIAATRNVNLAQIADERDRLRNALHLIAEGTYTEKGAEEWAKFNLRPRPAADVPCSEKP